MRLLNRVLITSLLLSMLVFASTSMASPARQTPVTVKNPLAYIGQDGNVYVTDGTSAKSQPITGDAVGGTVDKPPFNERSLSYRGLTWSSDGTILAFIETLKNNTVTIVQSGKAPVVVTKNADSRFPPAFSPDNKEIAWVVQTQDQGASPEEMKLQIQAAPIDGSAPHALGTLLGKPWLCAGDNFDPAALTYFFDVGMLQEHPLYFRWLTGNRFLHTMGCNGRGVALSSAVDDIWSNANLVSPALSPDGKSLIAVLIDPQNDPKGDKNQLQLVDLETGKLTPIETKPHVDRAVFSADGKSIIYTTKDAGRIIKGDPAVATGKQLMGEEFWPYEGGESTLMVWTMPAEGGTSTAIFKDAGQGIGFLSASHTEPLVAFSLTTSMGKLIDAINAGQPLSKALESSPRIHVITASTDVPGLPNILADGGEPAYSPGDSFDVIPAETVAVAPTLVSVPTLVTVPTLPSLPTAIPATEAPAATVAMISPVGGRCPGFLPSRLVVGGTGRVIPGGQWNRVRATPVTGSVLTQIPAGEVFNVLEGPQCSSNGIAWWKVNYHGTVGWTAEGQGSVYWLEPYSGPPPTSSGGSGGAFGIVGVTAAVTPSSSTTCPTTFNFTGQIVVNAPGTVTYRWERSDGATSATVTWNATAGALTKDEATTWSLGAAGPGWMRLHVLTPNDVSSNQANFTLSCGGSAFAVTGATASVSPSSPASCASSQTFTFTGTITTNGAGTVTYTWERSDGAGSPTQSLSFGGAGSQNVTDTWTRGGSGAFWERVKILSPNAMTSNNATATCP